MASWVYANYAVGPPEVSFLFQSWASHQLIMLHVGACYGVCFLLSDFPVVAMLKNGAQLLGGCNVTTLCSIPLASMCASWWWSVAHARSALSLLLLPLLWVGVSFMLLILLSPSHSVYMMGHTAQGAWQSHLSPPFCFIAQSHVLPGFMCKVSTLAHFLLEPCCEGYSFLNKTFKDFGHGPDSILMDSVDSSELEVSLMSLMPCLQGIYAWLVPLLIILDCSLLLASNLIN